MAIEYGLNKEQEMLQTAVREFLTKECPIDRVRELMEDDTGFSPELWEKMSEMGLQALVFPEEYGGEGMSFRDLAIVLDEMGRMVFPSPFLSTVLLVGMPVLDFGTEEQKKELLPKIADGELVCTLAALVAALFMAFWCLRKIGGITGDCVGAISEITEIAVVLAGIITIITI